MSDRNPSIEVAKRFRSRHDAIKDTLEILQTPGHVIPLSAFFSYTLARGFDPAPLSVKHLEHAPRAHVTVEDRVSELEKRLERQEGATEELALRVNSGSSQRRVNEVVEYMKNEFEKLEGVVQVSYIVLRDGTWDIVVVHDMEDDGLALDKICEKSIQVEDAFHVDVEPLVLHEDEVLDEHLAGTKPVFSRTDQK